ncbi:MAG TPA: hypothetical protein PLV15_07235, partial [Smithella sp.]|nr:hypothetical protein [Smithella sp.]
MAEMMTVAAGMLGTLGVGMSSVLLKKIFGRPDKPPVFIPPKKAPEAPKTASVPLTPGNMPTDDTAGGNAAVKDEKRRILKAM